MNGRQWRRFWLAMVLIAIFPAASTAEEAPRGIDPSLVIERFEILKDGDALRVPVTVFDKLGCSSWIGVTPPSSIRPMRRPPAGHFRFRPVAR